MQALNAASLIADARAETGLEHFGDDSFREPLEVLTEAIAGEADLCDDALASQRKELLRALTVQLRAQHYFDESPHIWREVVAPSIVIVGPQRSGTSKLFRMIAADPQWTKLYTWQALNPVPLTRDRVDAPDPRISIAEAYVERMRWLRSAHEMDAHAPEMEAMLMSMGFMTNSPTRLVPSHQRYCDSADHRPVYRWLHQMLQFIQWQNGGPRRPWILKSPTHLPTLDALVEQYPSAMLVMTHRHPLTSVASMFKVVELATQNNARSVNRHAIRDMWLRILSKNLQRFLEVRDARGGARWIDISYRDVHANAVESVQREYRRIGVPFTAETEQMVRCWEADNPQYKAGTFSYKLEDYGLTENDIEREFAGYISRFGHLFAEDRP